MTHLKDTCEYIPLNGKPFKKTLCGLTWRESIGLPCQACLDEKNRRIMLFLNDLAVHE